VTQK
jgi:hypothetical protein